MGKSKRVVTIVDYRTSNIKSVANMLRKIGTKAIITSDPEQVRKAEMLILPGVGAFDAAVKNLSQIHLDEALSEVVMKRKVPILGICLGMQLLADSSDEGKLPGLGWIPGRVKKFNFSSLKVELPIPHMGWNYVDPVDDTFFLFKNVPRPMRFYFVHSYHFVPNDPKEVVATTDYGYSFASVVAKEHVLGVQFHPEKSHKFGKQLLKNFVEME